MVNVIVIAGWAGDQTALTDIDLAGYLEDRIHTLVAVDVFTPAGVLAALVVDANRRASPLPAGTTVAAGHVRLVTDRIINPGSDFNSEDTVQLTVLYLKDVGGIS